MNWPNGGYPIIGVNTLLTSKGSPTILSAVRRMIRATEDEKEAQIATVESL